MKIFGLFSVANNYDQPSNNLVCFWPERPSMEIIGKALGVTWPSSHDETTLNIVKIWQGHTVRMNDTDYDLRQVEAGKVLV